MECPNCNKEVWPHFEYHDTEYATRNGRNAICEIMVAECTDCGGTIWYREWYIHEDTEYWGEEESE